jgi:integrase
MTATVLMTKLSVEAVKPKATRFEIGDRKVTGLRLIVQPSGAKSWAVRYTAAGRDRRLTLGPYPTLQLDDARKRASAAKLAVTAGEDPAAEKIEERRIAALGLASSNLMQALFEDYDSRHLSRLRPRSRASTKSLFDVHILPKFGRRRIREIAKRDILNLFDDINRKGYTTTATHVRTALSGFFNWCLMRDIIAASPMTGVKAPAPIRSRDRVLSDDEIRWLWRACQEPASLHPFGRMVQLALLTGARRDEVRGITDRELKIADSLWKLPATRAKNHREHDIHLTDSALAIIEAVPRIKSKAGLLFTTTGETPPSGFSNSKERLDRLMLKYAREEAAERGDDPSKVQIAPWVLHDLRRTIASGMARLGIQLPVIERCLNHISGSFGGIVGVYQRHTFADEKRTAFEAWSNHVTGLTSAPQTNVVALPKRAAFQT